MRKYTATFPPHRCEPRHLKMISDFAEWNGMTESEAMRFMIEVGSDSPTEEAKDIIRAYEESSMYSDNHFLQFQIARKMFEVIGKSVNENNVDIEKFHREFDKIFEKTSTKEEIRLESIEKNNVVFDQHKVV